MNNPEIEEIKSKIDIVDLISNYITLKKSGTNWKGLCPFHGEKTPSFMVNRQRQIYRCFGCGETGDIFSFIQKQENLDFVYTLKLLAERAHVTLPERTGNQSLKSNKQEDKTVLYAINELAAKFYHQVLIAHQLGSEARAYLDGRGVSRESMIQFLIGYAPPTNQALLAFLKKHNYSNEQISRAGSPERFRDRIVFPFHDVIGHVIGFSGRSLHDQMPKYLNTSETELFRKNRFLYGLYEGKKIIAEKEKALLVEGQLDLVLSHQIGEKEAIATSGTALTEDHLRILRRYTDTLTLCLDSDPAGQKATDRAIHLALPYDFQLDIIVLPEGKDPGDLAVKEEKIWKEALAHPKTVIDWLLDYHFPDLKRPTSKDLERIYNALFPYIQLNSDNLVAQTYQLQRLGLRLGIKDERVINNAFESWKNKNKKEETKPNSINKEEKKTEVPLGTVAKEVVYEKGLVSLLMVCPGLLQHRSLILTPEDFRETAYARLYSMIQSWYNKNTTLSSEQLVAHIASLLPPNRMQTLQQFIFDAESKVADLTLEQRLEEYIFLVQMLRRQQQEERMHHFADQIAQAEASGNRAKVAELMAHMQTQIKQKEIHAQEDS